MIQLKPFLVYLKKTCVNLGLNFYILQRFLHLFYDGFTSATYIEVINSSNLKNLGCGNYRNKNNKRITRQRRGVPFHAQLIIGRFPDTRQAVFPFFLELS